MHAYSLLCFSLRVIDVFVCSLAIGCMCVMNQARPPSWNSKPGSPKVSIGVHTHVFCSSSRGNTVASVMNVCMCNA